MQAPSAGSVGSAKGFTQHVAGTNNSSEGQQHGGGSGPVDMSAGGRVDRAVGSNGEVGTGAEENSDHSGEGVEDDGVSTVSRGSLLVGESRPDVTKHRSPATIIPTGGGGGGNGGAGSGGGSSSEGLGDYKVGEGKDNLSDDSRHMESDDGDADGLVGSHFLGNFGDHGAVATAAGVRVGAVGGGAEGWARVRGLRNRPLSYRHHPRIQPIQASPKVTPSEQYQRTVADDSGLGGVELLSSPGGTGVLDAFCSPLSEATAAAAGSEMTQAGDGPKENLFLVEELMLCVVSVARLLSIGGIVDQRAKLTTSALLVAWTFLYRGK